MRYVPTQYERDTEAMLNEELGYTGSMPTYSDPDTGPITDETRSGAPV